MCGCRLGTASKRPWEGFGERYGRNGAEHCRVDGGLAFGGLSLLLGTWNYRQVLLLVSLSMKSLYGAVRFIVEPSLLMS